MGLNHLPEPNRGNDSGHAVIFNNTWGHLSPQKNISYNGRFRFVLTDHSQYGCQPIILEYDFPNLEGPYLHDELFEMVCGNRLYRNLEVGVIYEQNLTFRNYRFYFSKINEILKSMCVPEKIN